MTYKPLIESDGDALTALGFISDKCPRDFYESDLPVFGDAVRWLDVYFGGRQPDFTPDYRVHNLTPFRKDVYEVLHSIPFGNVLTYGDIAEIIANRRGVRKMSAQAVGGAVGANPICLIIPCHRVVGFGNRLGGYGGGLKNKAALLRLEGVGSNWL